MFDVSLFLLFMAMALVGAVVYFGETYRQVIVKERRIRRMAAYVDEAIAGYETRIAHLLSYVQKRAGQDAGLLSALEIEKEELRKSEAIRSWKYQRLHKVSRRLFDALEQHPEMKDAEALNLKKAIYELEEAITASAQGHDAFVEAFNLRLRQIPEKWVADKFRISAQPLVWSEAVKKSSNK
jgi:hypothetical protein